MTTALPDFPVTTSNSMLPMLFEPPLLNPAPGGLYPVVTWTEVGADQPSRHLTGVQFRSAGNFPGDSQVGAWDAPWCSVPDLDSAARKEGERGGELDPFEPVVTWGVDSCDLTEPSRREVEQRAQQALRLREPVVVAREFAERLKLDAADLGATPQSDDPVTALAGIEGALAEANVLGYIHLSPDWLVHLVAMNAITRNGSRWVSPSGHILVFDGGYVAGLGDQIIATSEPFGWRDQVAVRTGIDERRNLYIAVAERGVVVGYEACIAAVTIIVPEEPTP